MRILVADDHAIIRTGLKHLLLEEYPSAFIGEAADAEESIKKTLTGNWDVVICDLCMPGKGGLDVVQHMKRHFPKTPVLILSMYPEEQYAIRAISMGAAGYLSKDAVPEELVKAIRTIQMGRKYISASIAERLADNLEHGTGGKAPHELLSSREFSIFQLISSGLSVSAISEKLSIGITTVSTHRSRVLTKMNVKSNADLTRYALENKLI